MYSFKKVSICFTPIIVNKIYSEHIKPIIRLKIYPKHLLNV